MSTNDLGYSGPELIPLPVSAVVLSELAPKADSPRQLAIAALRQALVARQLHTLSLGSAHDCADSSCLLRLNGIAFQLACCSLISDEISVDLRFWREAETAPQLLLAASVDEENQVVCFPGVLTGKEFVDLVKGMAGDAQTAMPFAIEQFRGGFERLLTLTLLMRPQALPRLALPKAAMDAVGSDWVNVLDWFQGILADALSDLGASLQPMAASGFRSTIQAIAEEDQAFAILSIPLAVSNGSLICGPAARNAIERLQLLVIPSGTVTATALLLRIVGDTPGALLPDQLTLSAQQGQTDQSITSEDSTRLDLRCPASTLPVAIRLSFAGREPMKPIPPLLLRPAQPLP